MPQEKLFYNSSFIAPYLTLSDDYSIYFGHLNQFKWFMFEIRLKSVPSSRLDICKRFKSKRYDFVYFWNLINSNVAFPTLSHPSLKCIQNIVGSSHTAICLFPNIRLQSIIINGVKSKKESLTTEDKGKSSLKISHVLHTI